MTRIIAQGTPQKYPVFGPVRIIAEGREVEIGKITYENQANDGSWKPNDVMEIAFKHDMDLGPSYPLCAEPNTMRRVLFTLYKWFGEEDSCWIEESKHITIEGEIDPMPSDPDVIY